MKDLFLGLDLGTSALKAGLFDGTGHLLALARRSYPLYTPQPGWAEQEPEDWWTAVRAAVAELLERAAVDRARIAAVGLSGQAPGHVLVDADGAPLGRAIIWSDRRAAAEAKWLAERVTREQALAWTAYPLLADSALPPARLLWLKAHRLADWARCVHVLQPKDFIARRLTGRAVTDNRSAFTLVNLETGRYDPDYFAFLGIPLAKMPPALEPHAVVGGIVAEAAMRTGLLAGTPVVCGTIDAWCDIIGCGGVAPGRAVDAAGTSEVVALITDRPVEGEGVFASPLVGDLYFTGGPTQAGGDALHWLARGFYPEMDGESDFDRLEADASNVEPGAGGLIFLPYLSGERAPVWDDAARAAFVGLTVRHTRAHCARAVYEGVAFAVRHILTLSERAAGLTVEELRVSGGGSRSVFWNQVKADVTGKRVLQLAVPDAACLGAAMLAAVGVSARANLDAASAAMVHVQGAVEPRAEYAARYDAMFAMYCDLYPALRMVFSRLSAFEMGRNTHHAPRTTQHVSRLNESSHNQDGKANVTS